MKRIRLLCSVACVLFALRLFGQGNGHLQLHFMDVGQGDAALLISPQGQTVLFDSGPQGSEDKILAYLQQLGVTRVDYLVTSHYHADHCGCVAQLFRTLPLPKAAYDRGQPKQASTTFAAYDRTLHSVRRTVDTGTPLLLDGQGTIPVRIDFVAFNGNGIDSSDENDQSVAAVVHFGSFDADFDGDLSGFEHGTYHDIETSVAPRVGQVEVYKVHHHGSSHSTNTTWIQTIKPKVGVISCSDGNTYGHPTEETLTTLHNAGVVTYWTERGHGVETIAGLDFVGGDITVDVPPPGTTFTVNYGANVTTSYTSWPSAGTSAVTNPQPPPVVTYAWSKNSKVCHYPECKYVRAISAANLQTGPAPPAGMTLHEGCPK